MKFGGLSALVLLATLPTGCAAVSTATKPDVSAPTLVGAWEVTAQRSNGVGKNLLTFSSDGTFFRSDDSFMGIAKTSVRDLQDNVLSRGTSPLDGRRIQVQPFE